MRSVLLILCFGCVSIPRLSAPHPRLETKLGRVVAYSTSLACLNGNGYWSMLIRVQQPKDIRSEIIRVDFSLPCGRSPEWVSAAPSIQNFRLIRRKDWDARLVEFMDTAPKQETAILIWKHPPGAEHDSLPFGQVVPCYRSADLPLAPAL